MEGPFNGVSGWLYGAYKKMQSLPEAERSEAMRLMGEIASIVSAHGDIGKLALVMAVIERGAWSWED